MRKSIVVAAVFAAIVGIYVFFISPLEGKREELREKLREQHAVLGEYEEIVRLGEGGLKAAKAELLRIERHVIAPTDESLAFSKLQIKVEDFASDSGLLITSIRPLLAVKCGHYVGLPIHLDAISDIGQLSEFLRKLDSSSLYMRIDKIDVSQAPQELLRVRMQISGLMKA